MKKAVLVIFLAMIIPCSFAVNHYRDALDELKKGNFNDSIKHFKLELGELKKRGPNSLPVAVMYRYLGDIYTHKGQYEKAIQYYKKDQAILMAAYGALNYTVLNSYNNLGFVFYKQNKYDLMIKLASKNLDINLKKPNPSFSTRMTSYRNLGLAYYGKRQYRMSLSYYRKALKVAAKHIDAINEDELAEVHYYTSLTLFSLKKVADAYTHAKKSVEIAKDKLGKDHFRLRSMISNMEGLKKQLNK